MGSRPTRRPLKLDRVIPMSVGLQSTTWDRLRRLAAEEGSSISALVRRAVEAELDRVRGSAGRGGTVV